MIGSHLRRCEQIGFSVVMMAAGEARSHLRRCEQIGFCSGVHMLREKSTQHVVGMTLMSKQPFHWDFSLDVHSEEHAFASPSELQFPCCCQTQAQPTLLPLNFQTQTQP